MTNIRVRHHRKKLNKSIYISVTVFQKVAEKIHKYFGN